MNGTAEMGVVVNTDVEKKALVERWLASGKSPEEFAQENGIGRWSLAKWRSKYFGRGSKAMKAVWAERAEKVATVDRLRESGVLGKDAVQQVGISYNEYTAWKDHGKNGPRRSKVGRPPKIRLIRELPFERPSENGEFNKSVMAENQALRKLVVDQALDIQALKDAMGKGR